MAAVMRAAIAGPPTVTLYPFSGDRSAHWRLSPCPESDPIVMPDFDALPLILAGPILRRVEPTSVSVWIALSASRTVEVSVWAGDTVVPTVGAHFGGPGALHTGSAPTIRIGTKLHLALVTIDATAGALLPNTFYSYNVSFTGGAGSEDLSQQGYLQDQGPASQRTRLALGHHPGRLPTFALPPLTLEHLRIVHGSCRKAHGHGPDGLAALDKVIERTRDAALERPHQIFLTGDQIYADDVAMSLLPQLTAAGNALLGVPELLPLTTPTGTEQIPATPANFPSTWRQELIEQQAKLTSGDAWSHALSFGEFCALYLFYWSEVLWGDLEPIEDLFPQCGTDGRGDCEPPEKIVLELPVHLRPLYPPRTRKKSVEKRNALRKMYDREVEDLGAFRKAIPHARRVLANVPTYMIFDDHEVTDDWNLTQDWIDRVYTSPLGVTALRNGLVSYALFQAWGNNPAYFSSGDAAQLLTQAQALFPAGGGPAPAPASQIDTLLGFGGGPSRIDWHYTVPSGPTTTIVLDTRTHRSFDNGRYGPPRLIDAASLEEQLPDSLAPSPGAELLFVVSPSPVLGLALIEEMAQPIGARGAMDFFLSTMMRSTPEISGYKAFDMEAWSLDAAGFEALLARFHELKKVVVLSGDVHYGFTAQLDYWKRGEPEPVRVVQLTSSALKNQWPDVAKRALETVKVQRLLLGAHYPMARLGWRDPIDLVGRVNVPGNAIPRVRRAMLRRQPVVANALGWPPGTTISQPPDWAWRTSLVLDDRLDDGTPAGRPSDAGLGTISPDLVPTTSGAGYTAVLLRGEKQVKSRIARSVVFASHVGILTLTGDTDTRGIKHSFHYEHPDGKKPNDPQIYTEHRLTLMPTADVPPGVA